MRRALLWALLLMVLATGATQAEPAPIPLSQYEQLLQQVIGRLTAAEQAATATDAQESLGAAHRLLADTRLTVQLDQGRLVEADLGPLATLIDQADFATADGRKRLNDALSIARQYLQAAQQSAQAQSLDAAAARRRLESALAAQQTRRSLAQRLSDWLARLFGSRPVQAAGAVIGSPAAKWIALLAAALGVLMLGRSLARSLSGNAGGFDQTLRAARTAGKPATPQELREQARRLALAGEYREALRRAHLALLQHFDQVGLIGYAPSLTMREYERLLRHNHSELALSAHTLNDLMELRLYAEQAVSADDFKQAEALVDKLWREGEAASKSAKAMRGSLSSASSR